ncbi:glycosyltransferase family 4 protein [Providencia stuartii]|uniref:glycosyltransferase family 4 protein n=1 Tax=Providencia stuartii TaxID=588 RepID=UPI00076B2DE1|nr:glycosyltransferase family 4 protein [Providencia stuartii]AMG67612.1 glycosyltransferase family 1 protein [Providencia stuartii]
MNILLLNTSFFPQVGGVENSLRSISESLTRNGHTVTIITSNNGDNTLSKNENLFGAKVIRYKHNNYIFGFINLINLLIKTKKNKFDLVISRNMITSFSLLLLGYKDFHYIVPGVHMLQNKEKSNKIKFFINCKIDSYCFKKCKNIYVLSNTMKEQIFKISHRNDINIVSPGVDTGRFNRSTIADKINLRKKYNLPIDKKIILGLGRFTYVKNYLTLIKSMTHIHKNYCLVLVGDGEDREKYNSVIQNNKLENRIFVFSKTQLPEEFYKLSDLFCLASTYEPFGQVLLEATSCGLHILALDSKIENINTATREVYNDYLEFISYIPENTPESFANTINSLPLSISIDEEKYDSFIKKHSWQLLIDDLKKKNLNI